MGNQHSHGDGGSNAGHSSGRASPSGGSLSGSRKEKPLSRSPSGADLQGNSQHALLPVDKLAKILQKHTQQDEHVQGISETVFVRYVFPRYPVLAEKLFVLFKTQSKVKGSQLGTTAFRKQIENFLSVLDDEAVVEIYVKMYSDTEGDGEANQVSPDSLQLLLMTAYRVAMDHYSEGPQMCLNIQKTLNTVVEACFHHKKYLSVQYVSHWLLAHCPRLLLPLHRFTVHRLATAHRSIESEGRGIPESEGVAGLDLATPVLEKPPPFGDGGGSSSHQSRLLPMSRAWLLAGALPPLYSRPREAPSPVNAGPSTAQSAARFLSKLISAVPSHWVRLYSSDADGRGVNRFLHHVLAYRGPTVTLLSADCGALFCVASPSEWRESHLYWGGAECAVLTLYPRFSLIDKGPKMLYLNTMIRGYPQGLRAGKDPRKPIISVDGGFDKMEAQSIPYALTAIEVWGCGDQQQRETQLDIKRWQVKEAERQRCVKLSAADWLDHPDRYLLELAGRPQYNNGHGQPQ